MDEKSFQLGDEKDRRLRRKDELEEAGWVEDRLRRCVTWNAAQATFEKQGRLFQNGKDRSKDTRDAITCGDGIDT